MRMRGFTVIEITVVLALAAILLGMSTFLMADYLTRTAARRAAQVFSRDLAQARSFALRSREGVTVTFLEDSLSYRVESDGGRLLVRRSFQSRDEITLTAMDLELDGDTLRFDARGLATLPGLGAATFLAGPDRYEVRFNGSGSSRVGPRS